MSTYSVALRVQRITYEDAYIAVPVTEAVTTTAEDGTRRIDPEALFAEGIRLCGDGRIEWQRESATIEVHPIQQPMPDGRTKLDFFFDDSR